MAENQLVIKFIQHGYIMKISSFLRHKLYKQTIIMTKKRRRITYALTFKTLAASFNSFLPKKDVS